MINTDFYLIELHVRNHPGVMTILQIFLPEEGLILKESYVEKW